MPENTTDVRDASLAPSMRTLWISWLSAPIIWSVHFTLTYVFADFGCQTNLSTFYFLGWHGVQWSVFLGMLLALALVGFTGTIAWRNRGGEPNSEDINAEFRWFMTQSGLVMSVLFGTVIVVTSLPFLLNATCSNASFF
jgi:hypothetical protein